MIWGPKAFSVSRDISWPAPPSGPGEGLLSCHASFFLEGVFIRLSRRPTATEILCICLFKNAYIDPAGVLHDGAALREK